MPNRVVYPLVQASFQIVNLYRVIHMIRLGSFVCISDIQINIRLREIQSGGLHSNRSVSFNMFKLGDNNDTNDDEQEPRADLTETN